MKKRLADTITRTVTFCTVLRLHRFPSKKRPTDPLKAGTAASVMQCSYRAVTLGSSYYETQWIYLSAVIHSTLTVSDRPPPVSLTSHALPLLVFAQGEDIMCRHSEDCEYKMWPGIDYVPWLRPASSSCPFFYRLDPKCCVVTGDGFVSSLNRWKRSWG